MGGRRHLEARETCRQMPVGGMDNPGPTAACLGLAERKPGGSGQGYADKDMLSEDPPGERDDHPGELVDGPEADQFRIVEPPWHDVPVAHDDARPPVTPGSDDRGDNRGDDRHAGADADADPDRDSDLREGEAARSEPDQAAGEAQYGDDLAARAFQEISELGEGGGEGGVGAGIGRAGGERADRDRGGDACELAEAGAAAGGGEGNGIHGGGYSA